jgi:hypothetical protein
MPFTLTLTGTVGTESASRYWGSKDHYIAAHDFLVPRDGTATLTLTWSNGSDYVDLELTPVTCAEPWDCENLATSSAIAIDVRAASREVKAGESYRIWVENFGDVPEDYRLAIEIR